MEKNDPLLPFAFTTSAQDDRIALSTDPRNRHVIDQNASSMYHTRGRRGGLVLQGVPSFKRRMGESFNEKDNIKRRDYDETGSDVFVGSDVWGSDASDEARGACDQMTRGTSRDACGRVSRLHTVCSSPPAEPPSEYDAAHDMTVPDSPFPDASPTRRPLHAQSSEADFGIDPFNRFKFSSLNQLQFTDHDVDDDAAFPQARTIILQAFENMCPSVSLAHMGLTDIPDEVRDLDSLVVFETPSQMTRQLYLNNNNLSVLNPNLFEFSRLNVLSLRQNKLVFIPRSIEKLQNLRDLNISSNQLRHLPPQILDLAALRTFRAGPNPYIEVTPDAVRVTENDARYARGLRWVSLMIFQRAESTVPTLKTLVLDTVANYDVTYRETKSWKRAVPKLYHPLIALAISKGQFRETCNECDVVVVESYAKIYEWWDILQNADIPIKRRFCSGKCAAAYSRRTYAIGVDG